MLTERQFVTLMCEKEKDASWAQAEFLRRMSDHHAEGPPSKHWLSACSCAGLRSMSLCESAEHHQSRERERERCKGW
eukprot:2516253-Amphidinium_carterae.1